MRRREAFGEAAGALAELKRRDGAPGSQRSSADVVRERDHRDEQDERHPERRESLVDALRHRAPSEPLDEVARLTTMLPPSSGRNGTRLKSATDMLITARSSRYHWNPILRTCAEVRTIPTGPETWSPWPP